MSRIIDLTLPVRSGMAGIPNIPLYDRFPARVAAATVVSEEQRERLVRDGIDVMADAPAIGHMNTIVTLPTHIGTHIDAPRHFFAAGAPVDALPLDQMVMRRAVVLDLTGRPDGAGITADDLERCGASPVPGEIAIIRTDWTDRAWGRPEFWTNTMYLDPGVGEWTAARQIAAVGMDCFPEKPFWRFELQAHERGANHRRWLGAGIPMIQMLTNLGALGERCHLIALPLRLTGMDGSPARVVGVLD